MPASPMLMPQVPQGFASIKAALHAACAAELAMCSCPPLCCLQVRDLLVSERDRLYAQLQSIPFLEPYPSHANFVLAKVSSQGPERSLECFRCKFCVVLVQHGSSVAGMGSPIA